MDFMCVVEVINKVSFENFLSFCLIAKVKFFFFFEGVSNCCMSIPTSYNRYPIFLNVKLEEYDKHRAIT